MAVSPVLSEELSSQTLQNDLSYYQKVSVQKNLNKNDRTYILEKIRQKYEDTNIDTTPLQKEIAALDSAPPDKAPSVTATKSSPVKSNAMVEKILVRETGEDSRVVITAGGVTKHNDFVLRDPDPSKPVKVILDLYGVKEKLKSSSKNIKTKSSIFARVITGQFETEPEPIVRISAELRIEKPYKIQNSGNEWIISIPKEQSDKQKAKSDTVPVMAISAVKPAVEAPQDPLKKSSSSTYMVEVGDILGITISPADELSREVVVQPEGTIELPLVGIKKAKDLTLDQLTENLTKAFSKYLSNPKVQVSIRQFSKRQIFITGETKAVGAYEYKENLHLLEFISSLGGFNEDANRREIKVYRGPSTKKETHIVNVEDIIKSGDFSKDFLLETGDIIEVSKAYNKICVLGAIARQGYYEYHDNYHLLELVSEAGGFSEDASISDINLIRLKQDKTKVVSHVNLTKILAGKEDDVLVQSGDTIYIPKRNIAKAGWFASNILPWLTAIALIFTIKGL
jgi:protein involved in polysaccharide export with SLBB domain